MLDASDIEVLNTVQGWLTDLDRAVSSGSSEAIARLFEAESYWRDIVATTWHFETFSGASEIGERAATLAASAGLRNLELDESAIGPSIVERVGREVIEAFFTFETDAGRGRGIVRLPASGDAKAWTLLTALEELKGYEEKLGAKRPTGQSHSRDFRGPNWLDQRHAAVNYEGRSPDVIIVGGGQAGLATAARLGQLGIDALIVDRGKRVGDNWRNRYHALTLHN